MFEIVDAADLKRYALITPLDVIFWDSDKLSECLEVALAFGGLENFKGIYDYHEQRYINPSSLEFAIVVREILGGENQ